MYLLVCIAQLEILLNDNERKVKLLITKPYPNHNSRTILYTLTALHTLTIPAQIYVKKFQYTR